MAIFVFQCITNAQDIKFIKPNYEEIKKEIKDSSSVYYYPRLLKKFEGADFTTTLDENRHLYYGFVFQKEYENNDDPKYIDKIIEVLQKKELNNSDYDQLIVYGDSILKKNPFNLRILNYQNLAFEKRGLTNRMISSNVKIRIIADAILSSGDGLTEDTAFYVINIAQEYDILNMIGYEFGGSQRLIKTNDYLTVKENRDNIKGLFFDISPRLSKYTLSSSSDSLKKEDIIGTWKIVNVVEKFKNKYIEELIKGFKVSSFIFNSDNTFHFVSKDKSRGILEFLKIMETTNWLYDSSKNMLRIGTKKDNYSVMGLKFIKKDGKTFFITEDNGMSLTFEVEKSN